MILIKIRKYLKKFSRNHSKLLFLIIILSFILFSLMTQKNFPLIEDDMPIETTQGTDPPWGVHQTLKNDARFSKVISWYTNGEAQSHAKYDTDQSNLSQLAQGFEYFIDTYYFHYVELKNLTPDTVYYFQCGSNSTGWSKIHQFQTAPALPSRGIHFGVYGDCRSNRERRRAVNDLIINNGTYFGTSPEFLLQNGDLVYSGDDMELWRNYALDVENVSANITIMPIQGNHEFGDFRQSYYKENFVLPENGNEEWYYSFSWGLAHFTALDSESHGISPYQAQDLNWIKEDLELAENDPTILWKFVYFHQAVFASASHKERLDIKSHWSPLFEQYGVDIVFTGHNHFYERSFPVNYMNQYNATGDPDYFDPEYPIYIVTAAAGMGDENEVKTRDNAYSAVFNGSSHWCDFNITLDFTTNTTRLELRVIGINNAGTENYFIDAINITKPIPTAWFTATTPADYNHPVTYKRIYITISIVTSLAGLAIVVTLIIKRRLKHLKS